MALKLTVESFLQVVRQSGLIDKDQLSKLLEKYAGQGVDVSKSQAIAEALITDEIVTRWQAEKLLAGKHKGFSLGKYRLMDLLGKGGMSSVYLAEHVLMKRRCAIKVLPSKRVNDSSYLARFHREAQAVASVDHPNIVRAYDVDCAQDRDSEIHFLVMEYVNGQSLQELIVRRGPADYADAVEYIRQAAEGLESAHRAGLVHRDIKPANLLIDTNGTIKLLDMGLARFFDDETANSLTVAHDEKVLGTADYLAPEQAMDSHSADTRADIYSLGCSLYFLLTGHPPFTEGTLTQRLMWHQTKQFPPLTDARIDCPDSLSQLLAKMVEKNPDDRFQTAAEVAGMCSNWLAENAGTEWKQHHVPASSGSSPSVRSAQPPPRDLESDHPVLKAASHVMESSLIPEEPGESSATKISRPGTVPVVTSPTQTLPATVTPPSDAPPVALPPPVIAPVVAPVSPPVARPVAPPSPPVAKPVVPIAVPVTAAPIVTTPVAQPVVTAASPVVNPPAAEETSPFISSELPTEATQIFQPENDAAIDVTVLAPAELLSESADTNEDNLFSLFNSDANVNHETLAAEPVEFVPEALSVEVDSNEPPVAESVVDDALSLSSGDRASFEPSRTETKKPNAFKATPALRDAFKNPAVRYSALALAVVLIGGIAWWSGSGSGSGTAATTKKGKTGKTAITSESPSDSHNILLLVGAGGEFKSIGRAIYSAIESRAEYEKSANGKPLRFIISVKPGQVHEDSIVIDETFPGEIHLKSDTPGKNFTLTAPNLTEPAILIKNRGGVTIENVTIDLNGFPQKEKGIVISGSAERCRIRNCVISDVGKAGIELSGAVGGTGADGIVLEAITIQNASPVAIGVHVTNSTTNSPTKNVTVQRCRFFGTMSSGVFVDASVESLSIRNCGASGTTSGVRFAVGVVAKDVLIDHCSFRNQIEAGVLFDGMPGDGSSELAWRNCLFAGASKAELLISNGYDANKFNALMSVDKPVENNWSDRNVGTPVSGERDLLGNGGSRVSAIQFEATGLTSDLFLVAKAGEPYKSAGIKAK